MNYRIVAIFCAGCFFTLPSLQAIEHFPERHADWLIQKSHSPVTIEKETDSNDIEHITLSNEIISRTFLTHPNVACVSYKNLITKDEFIRGVKPEARVTINGVSYPVGGLLGQRDYAYLDSAWLKEMTADPHAFYFMEYRIGEIQAHIEWNRVRYSADMPWPPKGKTLTFKFAPPGDAPTLNGLELNVHYAMYEGVPLLAKWLTIQNNTGREITIDTLTTEVLAVVERETEVQMIRTTKPRHPKDIDFNDWAMANHSRLHIQSDYSFCGMSYRSSDQTTFWEPDKQYTSQVYYDLTWPHLLTSRYPYGPAARLAPGDTFESFRTYEILFDSDDRERRGLTIRRMLRTAAPWCTENPIMLHLTDSRPEAIRSAVDQCAEVGFEMVILSFGSGLNMESDDAEYLKRIKADFDYAHSKGIEIGGYSLLASRSAGPEYDVIDPETGNPKAYYGNSPCLVSDWGEHYFERIKYFMQYTGCNLLEHDGSYPGDVCASIHHQSHRGLEDSQWAQHQAIDAFYRWCRAQGIYLNVPDYYFLNGSTKVAMGYREVNWSLPRALQIVTGRQNIYDGTWEKTPSMGWMFVPLVQYHGGGEAATIEPLSEHLDAYEAHLAQNFGSGVQACYRGPRLYDTDKTKAVVKKWVDLYKKYRDILDSDIIHLRRPDGRDYDAILHVNPRLKTKGLAMVYNPLDRPIYVKLNLPLYYTGLTQSAQVREQEGKTKKYKLDRNYTIPLECELQPRDRTWFVIE